MTSRKKIHRGIRYRVGKARKRSHRAHGAGAIHAPGGVVISTLDGFLTHLGRVRQHEATWEKVTFLPSSVIVSVDARGTDLDRRIDTHSATFVKNIQARTDELFAKFAPDGRKKAPLIKVEARDGSNLLDFDVTEVVKTVISTLPPEYSAGLLALLLGGAFGLVALRTWTKHKETISKDKITEKALDGYRDLAREFLGSEARGTAPIRTYARNLGEGRTLSVAGSPHIATEEVRKALATKRPRLPVYMVNCDGVYNLLNLKMRDYPPELGIAVGDGQEISASITKLDKDMQTFLVGMVETGLEKKTLPQPIKLHVDAYFTEKELRRVEIVGVGDVREDMTVCALDDVPWHINLGDARKIT